MRLPIDQPHKWYNAQGFGVKTSYGYHEGDDYNLKTGGNSDLGQPLFAIADGVVTSVHSHTTKPTFGNHVHIKHDGAWGTVWCHFAHCQKVLVKEGDLVKEGQPIAFLENSGTDSAHLHWSMKLQPTGIDGIAKTKEDLAKWTNPTQFVEKWKTLPVPQPPMSEKNEPMITIPTKDRDDLIARSAKLDEFDKRGITIQRFEDVSREAKSKDEVIKKLQEDHARFVERVAELIGSPKDENSVIEFCSRFDSSINDAEGYKDKYERLVEEKAKDASNHILAFTTLNNQVIEIKRNYDKEINNMQQKIDIAIKDAQIANEALKTATKFAEFWKWVVSRFSTSLVEKGK